MSQPPDPSPSPWIASRATKSAAPRLLVCFHHAGGSANDFAPWREHVAGAYDLLCVQLPGRGRRAREAPMVDIQEMADGAFDALRPRLDRAYVLAGHSMGGLVAYEVAHRIHAAHLPMPILLSTSARAAPSLQVRSRTFDLPRDEFLESLRRYGGLPDSVAEDRSLMDYFLPVLRADTQAYEQYRYRARAPLACPILVMVGSLDRAVTLERVQDWRRESAVGCKFEVVPGGHFFHKTNAEATVAILVSTAEDCAIEALAV
jgi:medium-chain acyl-[acyl-carrier-protein] hydrolase